MSEGHEMCSVPGCVSEVEYESPGRWCEAHWQEWWKWPEAEPEPPWMAARHTDSEPTPEPERKSDTPLADLAASRDRQYITPEDVQDAIDSGVDRMVLWSELLAILGKQRSLGWEDAGLCCFIAHRFKPTD